MTMGRDRKLIEELARTYTEAWCSHDIERIVDHYAAGGTIAFNGGEPVGIREVANYFVATYPDGEIVMDDLVFNEDSVEYHWTVMGTRADTGNRVHISGYEEWTLGADGLIVESRRHYDQAEYERQLRDGIGPAV
jgi:SnoaL-like domain